jgi:hypothetical protein
LNLFLHTKKKNEATHEKKERKKQID